MLSFYGKDDDEDGDDIVDITASARVFHRAFVSRRRYLIA